MGRLVEFREQLGQAIQFYQNSADNEFIKFELPSEFFVSLQKHHEKLLSLLEYQINKTESLAQRLMEDAVSQAHSGVAGKSERND